MQLPIKIGQQTTFSMALDCDDDHADSDADGDDDDDDDNDVGRMQIERELQTPAIVFTSQCKGAPIA